MLLEKNPRTQKPVTPAFVASRKGCPLREAMSEIMSLRAYQRDMQDDLPKTGEKRVLRKKHGEVSFPTQVRYDIVFFIGPVIIVSALL